MSGYNYIGPAGRIKGDVWGNCGTDAYHMQHYRNVDNTMRAYPEITANWETAGITADKWVAFYCGTGWRASETWFYAWLQDWPRIAVYDGGWFEWSQDPIANPIEVGDPTATEGEARSPDDRPQPSPFGAPRRRFGGSSGGLGLGVLDLLEDLAHAGSHQVARLRGRVPVAATCAGGLLGVELLVHAEHIERRRRRRQRRDGMLAEDGRDAAGCSTRDRRVRRRPVPPLPAGARGAGGPGGHRRIRRSAPRCGGQAATSVAGWSPDARSYTDIEALVAGPPLDAAIDLSPAPAHAALNQRLLDAGLHLYAEKPLASAVAEADQLIQTARDAASPSCAPRASRSRHGSAGSTTSCVPVAMGRRRWP